MSTAYLNYSLEVKCPSCGDRVELTNQDWDNGISRRIFNNRWDELVGWEVICDHCEHEFNLDRVEC